MYNFPSRQEKRIRRLFFRAEHGFFCSEEILYPSEVKKLLDQGFTILLIKEFDRKRNLGIYIISWDDAYNSQIPLEVFDYINGLINTCPETHIKTLAQRLYVIAQKVD